jgi:hypothetical protein
VRFEELGEQVAKLSKAGCLDAESIAKVKTMITSRPCTTLPVREKVADATPLAPPPLPPTSSHHVKVHSPSLLPDNIEDEEG